MSKVDIISGFLGAGKTTLIKKFINESLKDEKVVLIENEFGEIGIDGSFMRDAGIQVNELSQGCICCSLVGDFEKSLKEVLDKYNPDHIIIEPSGVGKLSDIIDAIEKVNDKRLELNSFLTVVDAKKCKMYHKNFGEFFNNQIASASIVVLSRTQDVTEDKLAEDLKIIKELNNHAPIITTPWDSLTAEQILKAADNKETLEKALIAAEKEHRYSVHHHHHEHECCHHHHDEEHECHHHHHDEEHGCHHHHHDEEHGCHHHHHHDETHPHTDDGDTKLYYNEEDAHDADEIFQSIGIETIHPFSKTELSAKLETLSRDESLGNILRSKGIVRGIDDKWLEFDFVAGDYEIRETTPDVSGRLCVIGENLDANKLYDLMKG